MAEEQHWISAEEFLRGVDAEENLKDEELNQPLDLSDVIIKFLFNLYPEWVKQAECAGMDDSVFFGSKEAHVRPALTVSEIKTAKAICSKCPVSNECFKFAVKNRERYGIWAGTSGRTRSRIFALIDSGKVTEAQVLEEFLDSDIARYEKVKPDER
jgi:WhiB family redox-sensing transcriptional regulator